MRCMSHGYFDGLTAPRARTVAVIALPGGLPVFPAAGVTAATRRADEPRPYGPDSP
jgi:hypothetical protein